jgi:hypothetical protein
MSKQSQNDLIGTVSRQPELEPTAAPIGGYRVMAAASGRHVARLLFRARAPCRFGTIGNSVGETPGRVQIARF